MFDIVFNFDLYLNHFLQVLGPWIYVVLFMIIFCETGVVVMPFLPGDSLLFALGAAAAIPNSHLDITTLIIVLIVAAILGDTTNYSIGFRFGKRMILNPRLNIRAEHIAKTEDFYRRHGGKTIIMARFIPIIRTFAPFVAGIGQMNYSRFASFNIIGAFAWILSFILAGYFFGNLPIVKQNFHIVIFMVIAISVLPIVYEWYRSKWAKK